MAGLNECNGQCHKIYPSNDGHIKRRNGDERILGSLTQTSVAIFHATLYTDGDGKGWGWIEFRKEKEKYRIDCKTELCWEKLTKIQADEPSCYNDVIVVKYENKEGNRLYEARYTSCRQEGFHFADEFFIRDLQNGELHRIVGNQQDGRLTIYLPHFGPLHFHLHDPVSIDLSVKKTCIDERHDKFPFRFVTHGLAHADNEEVTTADCRYIFSMSNANPDDAEIIANLVSNSW